MNRIAADMQEVQLVTAAQVVKVEDLVAHTISQVDGVRDHLAATASGPLSAFRDVGALVKGLRRGLQVYRQLGALGAQRRGASRRYAGDEHLFI
jgi:phage-related minor tail protein